MGSKSCLSHLRHTFMTLPPGSRPLVAWDEQVLRRRGLRLEQLLDAFPSAKMLVFYTEVQLQDGSNPASKTDVPLEEFYQAFCRRQLFSGRCLFLSVEAWRKYPDHVKTLCEFLDISAPPAPCPKAPSPPSKSASGDPAGALHSTRRLYFRHTPKIKTSAPHHTPAVDRFIFPDELPLGWRLRRQLRSLRASRHITSLALELGTHPQELALIGKAYARPAWVEPTLRYYREQGVRQFVYLADADDTDLITALSGQSDVRLLVLKNPTPESWEADYRSLLDRLSPAMWCLCSDLGVYISTLNGERLETFVRSCTAQGVSAVNTHIFDGFTPPGNRMDPPPFFHIDLEGLRSNRYASTARRHAQHLPAGQLINLTMGPRFTWLGSPASLTQQLLVRRLRGCTPAALERIAWGAHIFGHTLVCRDDRLFGGAVDAERFLKVPAPFESPDLARRWMDVRRVYRDGAWMRDAKPRDLTLDDLRNFIDRLGSPGPANV